MTDHDTPARTSPQETTQFEGATVEEAVESGLRNLGLNAEEAEIEVLDRGSRGFLGLGSRPARVAVGWKVRASGLARDLTERLFSLMEIPAKVSVSQKGREVTVGIECGEADGLLIGRKGETLQALQHVMARIIGRRFGEGGPEVTMDVAGYRKRREEQLRQTAIHLAQRVERTGKRAMTEPLPPGERRIIHRALSDLETVQSHTAGNGINRRVILTPTRKKAALA